MTRGWASRSRRGYSADLELRVQLQPMLHPYAVLNANPTRLVVAAGDFGAVADAVRDVKSSMRLALDLAAVSWSRSMYWRASGGCFVEKDEAFFEGVKSAAMR